MGFSKRYLPEIDELIKIHERFSDDKAFLKYIVGKSEALIGPSESHRYLEGIEKKIKKEAIHEVAGYKGI